MFSRLNQRTRKSRYGFFLTIVLFALIGSAALPRAARAAPPIYVNVNSTGSGVGNGATWATAYKSLQTAIDHAVSGDQIWVAAGTYYPSARTDPTNPRSATFTLKDGVAILGGFAGTESSSANLDYAKNLTTLSGSIIPTSGESYQVYHVIRSHQNSANTVLDGFTITQGNADDLIGVDNDKGAGLYAYYSSATLSNLLFTNNSAASEGGAISANTSTLIIDNVTFQGNTAGKKGGAFYDYEGSNQFTDVTFTGNQAITENGGAYFADGIKASTFDGVIFDQNTAQKDGGGAFIINCPPLINHATFSNNRAVTGNGGGLAATQSSLTVRNSVFTGNSASNAGGGAFNFGGNGRYERNEFTSNIATNWDGGGFYSEQSSPIIGDSRFVGNISGHFGGGLKFHYESNGMIINSVFNGNTAVKGGGIAVQGPLSQPSIINATVAYNLLSGDQTTGGSGIFIWNDWDNATHPDEQYHPKTVVANSIVYGNTGGASQFLADNEIPVVTYSDIEGGDPDPINGNLNIDPLFLGTNGDGLDPLSLQWTSPLIDHGNNAAITALQDALDADEDGNTTEPWPVDAAGLPRIADLLSNGVDSVEIVDMGAFEFQPPVLEVQQAITPETIHEGDTVTIQITVTNTGHGSANAVIIQNSLPATLLVDENTIEPKPVSSSIGAGNILTINWSKIGPGQSQIFTFQALARDNAIGQSQVSTYSREIPEIHAASADPLDVTILNATPIVTLDTLQSTQKEGVPVAFHAHFTDPGPIDQANNFTYIWDWGDEQVTGPGEAAYGDLNETHTYEHRGRYLVTLTVTDKDGGSGATRLTFTVWAEYNNYFLPLVMRRGK